MRNNLLYIPDKLRDDACQKNAKGFVMHMWV